jgi:2-polyprenyl-3-methyl-5-hydroxy-6-metoxy-1,4-benzoquinol methylase
MVDDAEMAGCCDPRGCDRVFGRRFAKHSAARYRRRGLDRLGGRVVELLTARGVEGMTVLEIGGGVGDIQLELLRRGATAATNLELSPAYEDDAARLAGDAGMAARVSRRLADLATDPEAVGMADVVVLNRVVCCYPDYAKLLTAAAGRARHQLIFSHPPRNIVSRAFAAVQNLILRASRREFRVFTHPPADMLAVLAEHGLRPVASRRGLVWQVVHTAR